jgi:hypothetical protein
MTTLELLRQRARDLASQIDTADDEQLCRVSAAIARAAVQRSGLSHPVIAEALEHLSGEAHTRPELRSRVQSLTEQLDADYFRLQELRERRGASEAQVLAAFSKARAAAAVASALGEVARTAAAETAYEAIAATDDSVYFTDVAKSVLTR